MARLLWRHAPQVQRLILNMGRRDYLWNQVTLRECGRQSCICGAIRMKPLEWAKKQGGVSKRIIQWINWPNGFMMLSSRSLVLSGARNKQLLILILVAAVLT